jgi:hypothetical protein
MEIDMRVNREILLKLAKETVDKRFATDKNVTAVFLVGSMRGENAFMGSAADIDLLVISKTEPFRTREIVKLSPEVHLDIAYESASNYVQPRELRGDPWRGWAMWDPTLLYEPGRFFEYTQAIVRAQFDDTANVLKRAHAFAAPARTAWTEMQLSPESASPLKILRAVANAANAFAALSGEPLAERRLLAEFPARAQNIGNPDLVKALLDSIGNQVTVDFVRENLPVWEAAFASASLKPSEPRIHGARLAYYKSAIESLLESDFPLAALWPMLYTWALADDTGNLDDVESIAWTQTLSTLGLIPQQLDARIEALDTFLDMLEETLEHKTMESGL